MKDYNSEKLKNMLAHRPEFKKRAVVTAGMPYGNKDLHYGHVLGMFLYADVLARFLRDRIGADNVIFVSGTDCYGSPSVETYRKMVENGYKGTLIDFVTMRHNEQAETLKKYQMSLNLFGASGIGKSSEVHAKMSQLFFDNMYKNGNVYKASSLQFYDDKFGTLLNGRQVIGKCPIDGCVSEKAYADECDLGHQFLPEDLIDPHSTLSGETPRLINVENWYFDLDDYVDTLREWTQYLQSSTPTREFIIKEMNEFLKKPEIYIKRSYFEDYDKIKDILPKHTLINAENKPSFTIVFDKLKDRENACKMLADKDIRYRTGKTLVPLRLSGNVWGVPLRDQDGVKNATFYVWPESLWAPISFTQTYLEQNNLPGSYKDWWESTDCQIYQILGEDNIYFYGPCQHAMWLSLQNHGDKDFHPHIPAGDGELQLSRIVANKHSLFLGAKASSSGSIKPPMANDLLDYYTVDQLRMHFAGLNVASQSASFMPKPFNPDADPNEADPVLKDGNLLTNVFNRVLRTMCYTIQRDFPDGVRLSDVDDQIKIDAVTTLLKYEKLMFENKYHMVSYEIDGYIRNINKYWVKNIAGADLEVERKLISDVLYMIKVALVLLHPIAPQSSENVAGDLKLTNIFDYDNADDSVLNHVENSEKYMPKFIEEHFDFFKKHPSQLV